MFPVKELDVTDLSDKFEQNTNNIELIDIRTPAEVAQGVIPNALTLPMHMIPLKLDYFTDTSKEFVIYCRTGSRSAQACMFLNQQGINNVSNLRGGIMSWARSGFQIERTPVGVIR
ncbi:MAG: rhodanese-like domain-containing protein [Gammaproteobacteria bacterium]|nr:rhodanese-like domain-containing protein [Gammaproteobacteria bacterium]